MLEEFLVEHLRIVYGKGAMEGQSGAGGAPTVKKQF